MANFYSSENQLELVWIKYANGQWCGLEDLNMADTHFDNLKGVYIIWSNSSGNVIRIGSGVIKDRISDHRNNADILEHSDLYVTWAKVNANQMQNVEKYLSEVLFPEVGERFPDKTPIEVNLPSIFVDK